MRIPEPRKLASGMWFIQLRLGGESIPVTAGKESDCKKKAALIKAEYLNGKRSPFSDKLTLTLDDTIERYIHERKNVLSPSSIRGYYTIKRNRFKSVMNTPVKNIKGWQTIIDSEAKLCSAKTLKCAWGLISSALRNISGIQPPNVTLPQVPKNIRPYLEPDEIHVFIEAVHGSSCEIPALLALSSLRSSEISALDWQRNIELAKRRVLVKGAVVPDKDHKLVEKEGNKNYTSQRYVPIMMDELCAALSAVENKSGKVVSSHPTTIRRQINKVCRECNLPEVGLHGLRHSFASLAYHLQMPEKIAMQIGGWADSATMHKIYTHLYQKDVSKYENVMTDFYKNANENANVS